MESRVRDVQRTSPSKTSRYRPEIDGLRAFAVVAVIINHFNKDLLPGGYLGVDIFFVISGYVITSSLFERPSRNFKDFISGFYERRIKRLVPALSVFVLITSIVICLFNPDPQLSIKTGFTSLWGLSNLYLLKQSTDYFSQSSELNVFTHTWSLGVEEQFYILFPLLIWLSGFGRQTKNGSRNLFLVVVSLSIASLIGFLYLYPINQPAAYFLMPSRFWEMAAGCLIFIGFQKRVSIEQFLEKMPPLLILGLMIGMMSIPNTFAPTSTIVIVVLSSVLIASLKRGTRAFKIFTNSKIVYIGLISYSLYLWHWGVLSISRWTIGIHWWTVPFQIALMLCLSIVSYRWIEMPLRKGNWFGKRWKTLVIGGGILMMLSGGLAALGKPLSGKIFLGRVVEIPDKLKHLHRKDGYEDVSCSIFVSTYQGINLNNECGHHIDKNLPTIYTLGDSHAWYIGNALASMSKDKKTFNVVSVWGNYCQFPAAIRSDFDHPALNGLDCFKIQKEVEKNLLLNARKGDIVLIANFSIDQFIVTEKNPFIVNGRNGILFEDSLGNLISYKKAQNQYFGNLIRLSKHLNIIGVKTMFYLNAGRYQAGSGDSCYADWKVQWYRPFSSELKRCLYAHDQQITKYRHQFNKNINNWIAINGPSSVIDAFDVGHCNKNQCDGAYFIDNQHLQDWAFAFLAEKVLLINNL